MIVRFHPAVIAVATSVLLAACQTTDVEGELIYGRTGLTVQAFDTDVEACETYVDTEGATQSEQDSATAASFLLGGIVGGIAAANAYENNKERLLNECLSQKGYRRVAIPEGMELEHAGSQGQFYQFEATRELIEKGQLDALIQTGSLARTSSRTSLTTSSTEQVVTQQPSTSTSTQATDASLDQETRIWNLVKDSQNPNDFDTYFNSFPEGKYTALARQRVAAIHSVAALNSEFPYDGTWRLKVDIDRTRQKGPDICKLTGDKPESTTIENGFLNFIIGSGIPTIVEADIRRSGRMSGRIQSAGYSGEVSTFKLKAEPTRIIIPFRIGESCDGTFSLTKLSSAPVTAQSGTVVSTAPAVQSAAATNDRPVDRGDWVFRIVSTTDTAGTASPMCTAGETFETIYAASGNPVSISGVSSNKTDVTLIASIMPDEATETGSALFSADFTAWGENTPTFAISESVASSGFQSTYTVPVDGATCVFQVSLSRSSAASVTPPPNTQVPDTVIASVGQESVADPRYPFDGEWRSELKLAKFITYSGGPDICYATTMAPRKITIKKGVLNFKIGDSNVTLVEGTVAKNGTATGTLDSRGWDAARKRFAADVRGSRLTIPVKMGANCQGSLVLRKQQPAVSETSTAARDVGILPESGFPYDGTWRLKVDIGRTRQQDRGPNLCNLTTEKPPTVRVENGLLNFVIGQGVPTIVTADIDRNGQMDGRISTAGYAGDVSVFSLKAKPTSITIPFRIEGSCSGTFLLRRSNSYVSAGITQVSSSEIVSDVGNASAINANRQTQVSTENGGEEQSDGGTVSYDGTWRLIVEISRTRQRAYGPSLCILSTRKPKTATIKDGKLKFVIRGGSQTIVEADIVNDGDVRGRISTGGYAGEVSTFRLKARPKSITIPFRIGGSCEGTFFLRRS